MHISKLKSVCSICRKYVKLMQLFFVFLRNIDMADIHHAHAQHRLEPPSQGHKLHLNLGYLNNGSS